jgi:hypothetical protein
MQQVLIQHVTVVHGLKRKDPPVRRQEATVGSGKGPAQGLRTEVPSTSTPLILTIGLRKDGATWKISHDIFNSDLPPPPPAK